MSGKGKSIILAKQAINRRSVFLEHSLVDTLPSLSVSIPSPEDWLSDRECIGGFTVSRIDQTQVLISFEVIEEASLLLKEFLVLRDTPFSSLLFWLAHLDYRHVCV